MNPGNPMNPTLSPSLGRAPARRGYTSRPYGGPRTEPPPACNGNEAALAAAPWVQHQALTSSPQRTEPETRVAGRKPCHPRTYPVNPYPLHQTSQSYPHNPHSIRRATNARAPWDSYPGLPPACYGWEGGGRTPVWFALEYLFKTRAPATS